MTQFVAILRVKGLMAGHNLASVRHESKLKIGVVGSSAVFLWLGLLFAFLRGFLWLQAFSPETSEDALNIGDILMVRLLSIFALALFFMLIFSNVLIAFSTMYKSREVQYLIQSPISIRIFFLARFVECVGFSSWASAYLGSPLILAYGLVSDAPWAYYAAAALFYIPFVTIPAALGSTATLVLVRVFPRLPRVPLLIVVALSLGWVFRYLRETFNSDRLAEDSPMTLLLQATTQTQSPLVPSYWVSRGILAAAENQYGETLFLFLLLASNALLFTWLAAELAEWLFLPGYSALLGSDHNRSRPAGKGVLGRLDGWLWFLRDPIRPLVVKDIKLFWRDPTQWTQFVIFFGIMAVYVANLGNQWVTFQSEAYRSGVAALNNGACSLILASLTSRFVYPLISLEGFRFWILGLAPLTIRQLMRQKFWLSVATTAPFTVGLVLLSSTVLDVGAVRFLVALYSICLANLTLAGLAVGLGSLYPNFQEDNPARIVSGMGGTLNFLLSVGYIAVLVICQFVLFRWESLEFLHGIQSINWGLAIMLTVMTVVSLTAIVVPMRLGLRNLMRTEF